MDVLSLIIDKYVLDFPFSYHWRTKPLKLTHLCFADDLLLFCHGDKQSVSTLFKALNLFSQLSGLIPNDAKSRCYLSNISPDIAAEIFQLTNFAEGLLPATFLGVPLITSKLTYSDCKPLLDKILSKLASWTNKFLSYAGRLQLIRSILFAMQAYWASVFIFPAKIIQTLTSVLSRFLWKGSHLQHHGAKVSWAKIANPFDEGGLNIKDLKEWNRAAILLQLWNIVSPHSQSLWAKWIQNTVLKDRPFWSIPIPQDCSWIWRKVLSLREVAKDHLIYCVGNGRSFSLWFDPWYKGKPLASSPRDPLILNSGLRTDAKVAAIIPSSRYAMWQLPRSNHHHVLQFRLHFDHSASFDLSKSDTISWLNETMVNTASIWNSTRSRAVKVPWGSLLWNKLHVPRFSFISWLLIQNGLKTKDRLQHYGISLDATCDLCSRNTESLSHLFFSCPYAYHLLVSTLRPFGWRGSSTVWQDIMAALIHHPGPKLQKFKLYLAFTITVYNIWKERNARLHSTNKTPVTILARELHHILKVKIHSYLHSCSYAVS